MIRHAVVTRGRGASIVSAELTDGITTIIAIERYPFDAGAIVDRVRELHDADPEAAIVVDVEGLGDAVWELLGERPCPPFQLYVTRGLERQELTRSLVVAVARHDFAFAPGLREAEAMKKALSTLTRDVREDGPGSELAVALSLALDDHRPPEHEPLFAWA